MRDVLLEHRHLQRQRPVGIQHEGGAVKHQFVLPADLVEIGHGQSRFGHARHHEIEPDIILVLLEGRAVGNQQDFRAGLRQVSQVSSVQISSQIGTPSRTPLKLIGPGRRPGSNTRFSSNTP